MLGAGAGDSPVGTIAPFLRFSTTSGTMTSTMPPSAAPPARYRLPIRRRSRCHLISNLLESRDFGTSVVAGTRPGARARAAG